MTIQLHNIDITPFLSSTEMDCLKSFGSHSKIVLVKTSQIMNSEMYHTHNISVTETFKPSIATLEKNLTSNRDNQQKAEKFMEVC